MIYKIKRFSQEGINVSEVQKFKTDLSKITNTISSSESNKNPVK